MVNKADWVSAEQGLENMDAHLGQLSECCIEVCEANQPEQKMEHRSTTRPEKLITCGFWTTGKSGIESNELVVPLLRPLIEVCWVHC
ncbi:hypothetical protein SLE2022_390290 [Rubroshorea leprosula]